MEIGNRTPDSRTLNESPRESQDPEKAVNGPPRDKAAPDSTSQPEGETSEEKDGEDVTTLDGKEDPENLSLAKKWIIVLTLSSASLCVTCCSSLASFTYDGIEESFGISMEVAILTISLYVEGLGCGPLLLGPLSEFYGRNAIYWGSYITFFLLNFPVAFAPNAPVHLIFRLLTGMSGSAFLSVAGGSVSDLFGPREVGAPMAVYTASPFLGPVVGPLMAGFINQHVNWRWTYYVLLIWTFWEIIALFILVPETYKPVLLKRKAKRLRDSTGKKYYAPMDRSDKSVLRTIQISCYKPFQILWYEPMAFLLTLWTSLLLGILYLFFNAFPVVFEDGHGFSFQETGMSFLGIGIGMVFGTSSQFFWWNKIDAREWDKSKGHPSPESKLYIGMAGAVAVPVGLFWFAFTTMPSVHWIVPIIGSIPFGTGVIWVYTSVFTFLVTTYRPYAASAMAANSFMRSAFAAIFPLFSTYMYARLGTVGASALLAGLTLLMAPLPFIFFRIGPRLREKSRFAPT